MPLFGAHLSIAGGYYNAPREAAELAMDTVQLFTKNNNQWKAKAIADDEAREFKAAVKDGQLKDVTAHDSYLINLASADGLLWRKSLEAFVVELERADTLGIKYLVMHPGAHLGAGEDDGLTRVIAAFDEIHERVAKAKTKVLVELTAGQGTSLGYRFEHLATILEGVAQPKRLGVCFDTCHAVAAGYDLSTPKAYTSTFREFDNVVGISKLKVFHVNDSKKPLGSRVDRHEHIGQGFVGIEAFRQLVNDPRFEKHPMILETPKTGPDDEPMDPVNLALLRSLVA